MLAIGVGEVTISQDFMVKAYDQTVIQQKVDAYVASMAKVSTQIHRRALFKTYIKNL